MGIEGYPGADLDRQWLASERETQARARPMPSRGLAQRLTAEWGLMSGVEVAILQEYVRMLGKGEKTVNIGAGAGTSTAAILESLDDVMCVSVDINPVNLAAEAEAIDTLPGVASRWAQVEGDSAAVGRSWPGGPLGLVFVDGGHSYEQCLADLAAWAPHVRNGGFMVCHDRKWPTVSRAIEDFLRSNPAWARNEEVQNIAIIQRVE